MMQSSVTVPRPKPSYHPFSRGIVGGEIERVDLGNMASLAQKFRP